MENELDDVFSFVFKLFVLMRALDAFFIVCFSSKEIVIFV